MILLLEGVKIGLLLSILVGPLFFTLVQASLEYGLRGGLSAAAGIWISDFLFITFVWLALPYMEKLTGHSSFAHVAGIAGGLVLISYGTFMLLRKSNDWQKGNASGSILPRQSLQLWIKGFLVNTVNPFTFFFWLGWMGLSATHQSQSKAALAWLFSGIMLTIICFDTLKVLLAKRIRSRMQAHHFLWLSRVSGLALIVFGVGLMVRVMAE